MSKHGFVVAIFSLFLVTACNNQARPFLERRLIIANKQTVRIPELHIAITNNGCGRKWIAKDNQPAYEVPYCDLVIKYGDSTQYSSGGYGPFFAGAAEIMIDRMNPWGAEEDSVPPGGCRVIVNKIPGINR